MKARNYNKVLSALAIVGLTASIAVLVDNFGDRTNTKSNNSSIEAENIIQFSTNGLTDEVTNQLEQVKIFNDNDALIAEFIEGEPVSDETLKLYRKADFLSKFNNLAIYKLSE
ncbi:hypothetical protein [uncultured Roseivirga sp.]|uniref:hypothetical protein n=1 Tax=uncultured Roseivirga sp. TaxID=543088 RepID=UPI0030D9B303|tara:strand:+ start:74058 stop:74396 length:339 start_codon:yes stop_codon:yes gene_type:complete